MAPPQSHSVLIVEDERIVAKDLQHTLAAMGYDAFAIASSADEALNRAAEKCPDLVLMDIRMSPVDGITATQQIRAADPHARIVMLTDYDDDVLRQVAACAGASGYLLKDNLLKVLDLFS
jgi:DNA-binding NarL/FixJ family response regulator